MPTTAIAAVVGESVNPAGVGASWLVGAGATVGESVGETGAVADGLGASDGSLVVIGVSLGGGGVTGGFDGGGEPLGAGPTYAVVKFAQRYARVVNPDA